MKYKLCVFYKEIEIALVTKWSRLNKSDQGKILLKCQIIIGAITPGFESTYLCQNKLDPSKQKIFLKTVQVVADRLRGQGRPIDASAINAQG